jgi:hypothetical protein
LLSGADPAVRRTGDCHLRKHLQKQKFLKTLKSMYVQKKKFIKPLNLFKKCFAIHFFAKWYIDKSLSKEFMSLIFKRGYKNATIKYSSGIYQRKWYIK